MNMKKTITFILSVVCVSVFLQGCSTIGTQEMAYLGDASRETQVIGSVDHMDWCGLGVSADSYGLEYQAALDNAFANAPQGTNRLTNIKAFKEQHIWPQLLGGAILGLGSTLSLGSMQSYSGYSVESSALLIGLGMYVGGAILSGINSYDFVLVAEPAP